MAKKVPPIPEGAHTITPYLVVKGATKAIEFYKKAFNAKELEKSALPDGLIMHAKLQIGDSQLMLSDEMPQSKDCGISSPASLKGSTVMLHLYVENVDAAFDQAIKAGGKSQMPVSDTFWGDRYGQLIDPFGHLWSISTQKEILTEEEVAKRAKESFSGCC